MVMVIASYSFGDEEDGLVAVNVKEKRRLYLLMDNGAIMNPLTGTQI